MREKYLPGAALTALVFSLALAGCDLLNNKPEIDLEKTMDDRVAYANAERLSVTVEYASDWGYSPQRGTGKAGDTRLGFAFTVEFTPAAEYGFERWIAVRNGDFNTAKPGATDLSKDLNGKGVQIAEAMSDTGAYIASVTISITEGITLMPLCVDRPKVRESNPPLTASPNPFPYDQKISLWFNMPIKDIQLGQEGSIRINAVRTSGINDVGDISGYFTASLEEDHTRLDLAVIDDISRPATDLGQLVITVTVGPGIESRRADGGAGLPMVSAQSFTYITSGEAAQKVYEAGNVEAARAAGGPYFQNSGTDWRDYGIDRRFNKTDKKTAHIKFTVQNPAGEVKPPNRFTVVERLYLDLGGFPLSGSSEKQYALADTEVSQTGSSYTITHELQTASSGIIQLIILPWLDDTSGYDAADPLNALATTPPQYVTVVLDNAAPGLNNPGVSLSGHASESGGLYTYGENSSLTLTVGRMAYLSDNAAEGGIGDSEATGKPWTKDRLGDLEWRTVFESGSNPKRHESVWQSAAGNTYTVTDTRALFDGDPLDTGTAYEVKLQFKDRMGNVSGLQGTGLRVEYSNRAAMIADPDDLEAFRDMVNGGDVTNGKEYILTADITLAGDWDPIGIGSSNAFQGTFNGNGHTITVGSGFINAAYTGIFGYTNNAVIRDLAVVYTSNVSAGGSATHIGGIVGYAGGTTAIRNCVVSGASSVTLQKTGASTATSLGGMAGYLEPGAVIVNGSASLNVHLKIGSAAAYTGGAVGRIAEGTTSTTNLEGVSVSGDVTLVKTGTGIDAMSVGGVVGASENFGSIKNVSFSGTVNASKDDNTGPCRIGGVVGYARRTNFSGCVFTGTVKTPVDGDFFEASGGPNNETRIGGIVGHYTTGGYSPTMENSTASGMFSITHTGDGTLAVGGVAGLVDARSSGTTVESGPIITITNCRYEQGTIILERTSLTGFYYDQVGGFAGKVDPGIITDCASMARLIKVTGKTVDYAGSLWVGGFVTEIRQGSTVKSCYSTSPVEAYNYSPTDASRVNAYRGMMVGGFVAFMQRGGAIEKCYASGDVTAYADNQRLAVGGFAGRADKNDGTAVLNTIQFCYAAGNVNATSTRSSGNETDFDVGGFIGKPEGTMISDCYALGEVFADAPSGDVPVCAGGIAGYLADDGAVQGTIQNCFATGSVTAKGTTAKPVYAGGIVGYVASGTVQNNAALGSGVTAQGGNSQDAGRVYGSSVGTNQHNYALNSMTIEEDASYTTYTPAPRTAAPGATGQDGADASASAFRNQTIWTSALGFSSTNWDFSTIYKGRPKLAGLGGQ